MKRATIFAACFALGHVAAAVVEHIRFRRQLEHVHDEARRILFESLGER